MLFRVVALAAPPHGRQKASLFFGQSLMISTLVAGLAAVFLVSRGDIRCRLDDVQAGASASLGVDAPPASPMSERPMGDEWRQQPFCDS